MEKKFSRSNKFMNSFWIVMSHILMVEAPRLRTWYRTFKHMKLESKIHMPDLPNSICNENLSISTKKTNQNLWNMLASKLRTDPSKIVRVLLKNKSGNHMLSRWVILNCKVWRGRGGEVGLIKEVDEIIRLTVAEFGPGD